MPYSTLSHEIFPVAETHQVLSGRVPFYEDAPIWIWNGGSSGPKVTSVGSMAVAMRAGGSGSKVQR